MPQKIITDFCTIYSENRTITVDYLDFPLAAESASKEIKCGFVCDKYLYGYCPSASICPIYKKI